MHVSYYNNTFDKNNTPAGVLDIAEYIKGDSLRDFVSYLRSLGKKDYDAEKKKLSAVTWSGLFSAGERSINSLKTYSGLVCMDFDKIDHERIKVLKEQFSNDPHILLCFVSPSGTGIKVVVPVSTGPEHHRAAFMHLEDYFQRTYFVIADRSGKDVSRLCYLSWDPEIIVNVSEVDPSKSAVPFTVDTKYGEIVTSHTTTLADAKASSNAQTTWKVVKKWIEGRNKFEYAEGQRNVYIHAISCAMNRCGIDMETTIRLIDSELPTPDRKWLQSVRSAYFHHQHEHGAIKINEVGSTEFVPPVYISEDTSDPAIRDIKNKISMLMYFKVPHQDMMDVVLKLCMHYHNSGYFGEVKVDPYLLVNEARLQLQENIAQNSAQFALKVMAAEDMGAELVRANNLGALPTFIDPIDRAMGGGLQPSNFYAMIGFGGTYKSFVVQYWAYRWAMMDIPTLYLNSEMALIQFYERLCLMVTGKNLKYMLNSGELSEETLPAFIEELKRITKGNIHVFNGSDYKKENLLATIDNIYATTGKKIRCVILDGLTQMSWLGREEVTANIFNSGIVKEVAKESNQGEGVTIVALIHCSGAENKLIRNTGSRIRGGTKVLANTDAYFSTSLYLDPETMGEDVNAEDYGFLPGKFNLRLTDKRSTAGVIDAVLNVTGNAHIEYENEDPRKYEVSKKHQPQSY